MNKKEPIINTESSLTTVILIDAQNIEMGIKRHCQKIKKNGRLRWKKLLLDYQGHRVFKLVYYRGQDYIPENFEKFEKFWEEEIGGIIVKTRKDADARIMMDAVRLCEKAEKVVLMSGDKDFLDVITYLKNKGCSVEIRGIETKKYSSVAEDLKNAVLDEEYYPIDEEYIEISSNRRKERPTS